MAKPNLRLTTEARSPEREKLAASIEHHDAAVAHLARLKAAHTRAADLLYGEEGLIRAAEQADAALAEAKQTENADLARAFISGDGAAPSRVKTAAAAAEKAAAELAVARRTRDAIEAQIKTADAELQWAESRRDDALREAIRVDPAVQQLVDDYTVAFRTFVDHRRAMEFVSPLAGLQNWRGESNWPELPGAAPWRAWLQALMLDADAPAPT